MKTFIFIFILIIGFFYYLFVEKSSQIESQSVQLESLEDVEKINNIETKHEVEEYVSLSKELPTAIPEDQTFDTIKNILKEVSGRRYSLDITLNTRVNSYLYTLEKREEFKQRISSAFNLGYDDVDKMYQKNKLVWDWVNEFRE